MKFLIVPSSSKTVNFSLSSLIREEQIKLKQIFFSFLIFFNEKKFIKKDPLVGLFS